MRWIRNRGNRDYASKLRGWLPPLMLGTLLAAGIGGFGGAGLALDHEPDSPKPLINRGDEFFHQERFKEAAEMFRRAVEAFPQAPIPHLAYGHALFAQGKFIPASRSLQAGVTLFPKWAGARINLRNFFTRQSVFERRLEDLEARGYEDFDGRFLLGYIYHFSGRKDAGERIFLLLEKDYPANPALRAFLPGRTVAQSPACAPGAPQAS